MHFLKSIILTLFLAFPLFGTTIIDIDNSNSKLELLSSSQVFIDKTNTLKLEDIKDQTFVKNGKNTLSYGYSPKFTVWVKFTLRNTTGKPLFKILEYGNPITTNIEFYDGSKIYKDGLFWLNLAKESINPVFNINLNPSETKTYYIKAQSKVTTLIIKLNLLDKKLHQKESFKHQMILAMFFAVMGILAVYNFFIYFFTKDKNYLFYVLYMAGLINHQLFYTGFGNIYFFSQEVSTRGVAFAEFYVAFTIFMFALLVRSFLNIKQYRVLYRFYSGCLVLFPVLVTIVWYFEIYTIRNLFSFLLLIITTAIVVYSIYKKNRQAYFVGFGWLMFALAVGFMYLSSTGIIDIFDDFRYFVEVGLVLEAVIFSIALADKIKQLEHQKNKATMELIIKEQTEKQKLEKVVEQKTKELLETLDEKSLLLKELNHRVKNNMQLIVSILRLQRDRTDDEKTKKLLSSIKGRINAMGTFHELLYKQDNISYINANEYFHSLVDELKSSFQKENVTIKYNIQTNLQAQDAIYCGLILNELVTNSLKYAFGKNGGDIHISLSKNFDSYILTVQDNGTGYDDTKVKKNLGSTLVDSLVKKQLKGEIKRSTNDGVKVLITWQKR